MNRFVSLSYIGKALTMFLLVLMGLAALAGVLTLMSEKVRLGDVTHVEGRHARIVGMLLMLPLAYTFVTVMLYGILQLVTDGVVPAITAGTMNTRQHVVTCGSLIAALGYTLVHRGEVEHFA